MNRTIDIVFHEDSIERNMLTFVEVERDGVSIGLGEWVERDDGYLALRIPDPEPEDCEFTEPYVAEILWMDGKLKKIYFTNWEQSDGNELCFCTSQDDWVIIPRENVRLAASTINPSYKP